MRAELLLLSSSFLVPCLSHNGLKVWDDAMYAPVVTRFLTYHVKLDDICGAYCRTIMAMPEMIEWIGAAKQEPENVDELEVEF